MVTRLKKLVRTFYFDLLICDSPFGCYEVGYDLK